jgi:hypothetical protein
MYLASYRISSNTSLRTSQDLLCFVFWWYIGNIFGGFTFGNRRRFAGLSGVNYETVTELYISNLIQKVLDPSIETVVDLATSGP